MEKKEKKSKLTLCDGCVLIGIQNLLVFVSHSPISQAMEEKKLSDMVGRLQRIRSRIRLYKADNGVFPGQEQIGDSSITSYEFIELLKRCKMDTNEPYLGQIPVNPYVSDSEAGSSITFVSDHNAQAEGTEGTGWWYNTSTGRFYACDSQFHTNY